MRPFADREGRITLPPTPLRREIIGGIALFQQAFRGGCFVAKLSESEENGHALVQTRLSSPFDGLLLRRRGARRAETGYLVLSAPDLDNIDHLGPETRLVWDDLSPLTGSFSAPEQILESWKDRFLFREEAPDARTKGMRPPQAGALHAIAAHFSIGSNFEPATVVLPTGTVAFG